MSNHFYLFISRMCCTFNVHAKYYLDDVQTIL